MVEPDVARAKIPAIDRHATRVREVRAGRPGLLPLDVEEIVLLNLLAAVQACLDLASHVVSSEGYGLPATLAETFTLLERNGVVDGPLAASPRRMAGFRNVIVHRYAEIDAAVVDGVARKDLDDLLRFAGVISEKFGLGSPGR